MINKYDQIRKLLGELETKAAGRGEQTLYTDPRIKFQHGGIVDVDKYAVLCIQTQHGFSVRKFTDDEVHSSIKLERYARVDVSRGDIVYMSPNSVPIFDTVSYYYMVLDSTEAVHWVDGSAIKTDVVLDYLWKVIL